MSQKAKTWLTVSVALIAVIGGLFLWTLSTCGWDITKFSTHKFVTNTYTLDDAFENISIHLDTANVVFAASEDDGCRVVCFEAENRQHSVAVRDGALCIDATDTRSWYDFLSISFLSPSVTVYLPNSAYKDMTIDTDTGDVSIPKNLTFQTATIDTDTGDVEIDAIVSGQLETNVDTGDIRIGSKSAESVSLKTDTGSISLSSASCTDLTAETATGKITLQNVAVSGKAEVKTDTGGVYFNESDAGKISVKTSTGGITLQNVLVNGKAEVKTDTGGVYFNESDAGEISVKTSTGSVTGTLLTEKIFIAKTNTGKIDVPPTTSGGKCEIVTSTGSIHIEIVS